MAEIKALLTEQPNPATERIDTLPTLEMLRAVNAEDRKVADAVAVEAENLEAEVRQFLVNVQAA